MQKQKILKTLLAAGAVIGGTWLFVAVLLPLILPFLLAFLLAVVTEKPALYLMKKIKIPRWLAGGFCTLAAFFLLFLGIFLLLRSAGKTLAPLARDLPTLLEDLAGPLQMLQNRLLSLTSRLPEGLSAAAKSAVEDLFSSGAGLLQMLPGRLFSLLTAAAKKVPGLLLGAVTTVLASFMSAAGLPRFRAFLSRVLPGPWRQRVTVLWQRMGAAFSGWLKAQGKLAAVTLGISFLGLWLLGVPAPWRTAPIIALVDALPVFGSGAVLLPWAAVRFLQGSTAGGVAMTLLYGAVAITRATLEPRLMGRQMGLPPIVTLAALYVGGRLCGVGGLVLFPVAAAILGQILRWGKG